VKRPRLAILLVVLLAGWLSLGWGVWSLSREEQHNRPPAGLLPLADAGAFPVDRQTAARAVADALARSGEPPEEFFAEVEDGRDGVVVFHLWHRSAFDPENRGGHGNPGGKCRDVYFDPSRGEAIRTLFWQ
jgi:hypothetical protein